MWEWGHMLMEHADVALSFALGLGSSMLYLGSRLQLLKSMKVTLEKVEENQRVTNGQFTELKTTVSLLPCKVDPKNHGLASK